MRRWLVVAGVLWSATLLLSGCGHLLASVVSGHDSAGWCAFHGWRAYWDLKRGHPAWSAYQLWRAVHACS
jgi:hypothetical protein